MKGSGRGHLAELGLGHHSRPQDDLTVPRLPGVKVSQTVSSLAKMTSLDKSAIAVLA